MEYSIKEIAGIIGADAPKLYDAPVSILLTDSRRLSFPEQSLFFALQTKTNDGHNYIQGLYKLRVRNFVVSTFLPEFESMPEANFLVVKDTLKALQKLAAHHRKRFNIPVIGITGSNGKTIVKEFLYQLLQNEFNIVRSPRSYNSQLGVPLSVWQMSDKNTLGIFEAGISQPDEMERLQPIIAPTIGVITNIGEAHQENFISSTQKCLEKLTLFNDCEAIIYDGDDAFIANCIESACLSHKAITWSRTDSEAPLYIESIKKLDSETIIRCTLLGFDRTYTIPFTDDASIENRHPLYGRDVVSETDKRKRYRKIQTPRTGCHALGHKAGYQQLPIDKRHLQFGYQFFGYRPRLPTEPPRREEFKMHTNPFRHPAIGNVAEVSL